MPDEKMLYKEIPCAISPDEYFLRSVYHPINFAKKKSCEHKSSIIPTALRGRITAGLSLFRSNYITKEECIVKSKEGDNPEAKRLFCGILTLNYKDIYELKAISPQEIIDDYAVGSVKPAEPEQVVQNIQLVSSYDEDASGLLALLATPMHGDDRVPPPLPKMIPDDDTYSSPMHAEIFYLYESVPEADEPRPAFTTVLAVRLLKKAEYEYIA